MKKLTKIISCIILSVMLIIASLPFSAFMASASEKTVYEYLTDSESLSDENITVHSGVSWDGSENAASFNGSSEAYIQINNAPFENVTRKNGFTVSVDVKRNSSNGNYARILDFSNGTTNNYFAMNAGSDTSDAFVRYCVFTKLNGNEIRYYGSGSGDGARIFVKRNFLEEQAAGQWHNVKVSVFKFGNAGRLYYYFDNTLYYIYEVSNYDSYIESFENYTTYYIGKSIWNDPLLNGYMKNLKITVGVPDETRELFHFTFDSGKELGDEHSSSAFTLAQAWSDPGYQQFSDHIWLRDGWLYSAAPGTIRDVRYNKNWKIDFSFSMTDSGVGANRLERVLGITSSEINSEYNGSTSFGLSTNGKLYYYTDDFNSPFGDTGVNLKEYFFGEGNESRQKPMKLSYAYHNGIISVLINDELKFSADVSDDANFFENIASLTIGGHNGVGNWIDIFDLTASSYQKNEDASDYLAAQYLVNDISTDEFGNHNLSLSGAGAEWVNKDNFEAAHFLGEDSSDSSIKNNYLYLPKSEIRSILSDVNANTGVTISFLAKRNSDSWQRFFELTNANSGFSGDGNNNFIYFAANGNMNVRTDNSEGDSVPNISDLDNWHVWTMTVVQGGIIAYRDGVKVGARATSKLSPSWFNDLVNDCMLLIGAATPNWDNGANFWMRDFRLYDIALNETQVKTVYGQSGQEILLRALNSAKSAYENRIQSGAVLNNTKNAYDAYVYVNRLIDAVTFGNENVEASVIADACSALNNATNNLTDFSRSFSVPWGSADKWASHDAHGAEVRIDELYHNVLWSSGVSAGAPGENDYTSATAIGAEVNTYSSGGNKNSIRPAIYRESAVLVYTGKNGDDPRMPVMFRARGWRGGSGTFTQRHRAVYIADNAQGMYLNSNWRGTDGQLNLVYSWFFHGEKNVRYWNNGDTYNEVSSGGTGHKAYYYANVLHFGGSNVFSANQYAKTINGITWGFIYSNNNDSSNASQTAREGDRPSDKQNDSGYNTTNRPIYVLNYAAVLNQLSSAADFAKNNITNYKEGGLSDFFARYEEATALNPDSYSGGDWESGLESKIDAAAEGIKNAAENLRDVSKTADAYNNLRNEMGSSHGDYNSAQSDYFSDELDTAYIASSIVLFKVKYENAAAEMALLADNPYKSTVTSVYTALANAHHALARKADFTSLLSDYQSRLAYSQSAMMDMCTTQSVQAFREALVNNTKYVHYSEAQQNETPISEQSLIDEEREFINNGSSSYLDFTKSLEPLSTAYEQADDLLLDMNNEPAVYTWAQLEQLVETIENSAYYLNASSEEKREFGIKSDGNVIDELTANLESEYASIANAETPDLDAYNALWESAQSVDSDAYDYPAQTLQRDLATYRKFVYGSAVTYTNLSGDTATINVLKSGVTSATVDAAISLLQTSFTNRTRMYTVSITRGSLSDINGITFVGGKYKEDKENGVYLATYGTKMNLSSDSDNAAWYMEFNSETAERNLQYQDTGKRFSTNVFGNINVSVKTEEDGNKVSIVRAYSDNDRNPISRIDYVADSFTVPNASALPYYTFTGYTLNGESVSAGDTIPVNEDITIIANYVADAGLPFAINVEDESIENTNASYNDAVFFEGNADTYAWLEKKAGEETYKPFFIGKDITFFATEETTLKPVTQAEFNSGGYTLPGINVRQSGTYVIETDGKKKVTFNGQFVTDGSKEIVEYGILLGKATSNGSISASDVLLENISTSDNYTLTRFKSTKDVGAHQFTIAVNGLSGNVIYKGYISYKNEQGITVTLYTDAMTETI